jgi:hypothetical protein
VIELVNRRYIPFFFNVGARGQGYDKEAAEFIAKVDKRFSGPSVPTPPVWVFSPDGELITTIDNYTPKAKFYDAIRKVLRDHPALDADTDEEKAQFGAGSAKDATPEQQLIAARLNEELGRWAPADAGYTTVVKRDGTGAPGAAARLGLARLARYRTQWKGVDAQLKAIAKLPKPIVAGLLEEPAVEQAHRLLAAKAYAKAYKTLVTAAREHPKATRLGEIHFYAGVAAFHLKQRPWANFHWCYVMKELPDDALYMRCYLAATVDAMPYANPELDGYRGKSRMISHQLADRARDEAMEEFAQLAPAWKKTKDALQAPLKPSKD